MKKLLAVICFFTSSLSMAQTKDFNGTYENKTSYEDGMQIDYEITLSADGTFSFHFYQDQLCYEDDSKGKGRWKINGSLVVFEVSDETDINEEFRLNFNKSEAKVEEDVFQFIDCSVDWLNDVEMKKIKP